MILACLLVAALGVMSVRTLLHNNGTESVIAAVIYAAAPLLLLLALRRPLVFPYTVFVFLIPFENIITLPGFGTITRLLGILAAVPIIFSLIQRRVAVAPPAMAVSLVTFLLWAMATIAWAPDPANAVHEFGTMLSLILLYVAILIYPATQDDLRAVLVAVILGGIAASVYGIWILEHDPSLVYEGRLFISFGDNYIDPNHFADALILPTALLASAMFRAQKAASKLLALLGLCVVVGGIYSTLSREALLALGLMLLYFFVRGRYRKQAGSILIAAVAALAQPAVIARFNQGFATGGAGRTSIWKVAVLAFSHYWPTGVGIGNFSQAYDEYYLDVFQSYSMGWGKASHNLFLHYGVELGIVGLTVVLAIWLMQFRLLRDIRRDDLLYDSRIALEASVVALFAAGMFIDLFSYKYTWLAFVLIVLLRNVHRSELATTQRDQYGLQLFRP